MKKLGAMILILLFLVGGVAVPQNEPPQISRAEQIRISLMANIVALSILHDHLVHIFPYLPEERQPETKAMIELLRKMIPQLQKVLKTVQDDDSIIPMMGVSYAEENPWKAGG